MKSKLTILTLAALTSSVVSCYAMGEKTPTQPPAQAHDHVLKDVAKPVVEAVKPVIDAAKKDVKAVTDTIKDTAKAVVNKDGAAVNKNEATIVINPLNQKLDFDINVTLSDKAREKLLKDKEGVAISVDYDGLANAKAEEDNIEQENDFVLLSTQTEDFVLPKGEGTVHATGRYVIRDRLRYVEKPRVSVVVSSARKVYRDNILYCDVFDSGNVTDLVDVIKTSRVQVTCKLMGE